MIWTLTTIWKQLEKCTSFSKKKWWKYRKNTHGISCPFKIIARRICTESSRGRRRTLLSNQDSCKNNMDVDDDKSVSHSLKDFFTIMPIVWLSDWTNPKNWKSWKYEYCASPFHFTQWGPFYHLQRKMEGPTIIRFQIVDYALLDDFLSNLTVNNEPISRFILVILLQTKKHI